MKNSPHLTTGHDPVFARQIEKTRAGMASWAAQGPFGAVCSDCGFYGYHQQIRDAAGNAVKSRFRERCCGMFFRVGSGRSGQQWANGLIGRAGSRC